MEGTPGANANASSGGSARSMSIDPTHHSRYGPNEVDHGFVAGQVVVEPFRNTLTK
jgi:hypothetical protein